jgi:hypothetical protein
MRQSKILGLSLLVIGCRDPAPADGGEEEPLPEIIAEGERVRFATTSVEQVCAGTITAVDDELARIEQALELTAVDAPVDVYLLGPELLAERCGPEVHSCSAPGEPAEIYLRAELYERRIVHELVHDRLAYTPAASSPPVFDEGLAAAHAPAWCPPLPSQILPEPEILLAAADASELPQHGEYLGGELVRWLLDTHGPAAVLEFMGEIRALRDAASIRAAYLDRFGEDLDAELFNHLRELDEPLSPAQAGCLAPEAPAATDVFGVALDAELDCDSPRVHNDFGDPSRLYVEWTLHVGGTGVYRLQDELPEGTELRIEPCVCQHGEGTQWSSASGAVLDHDSTSWASLRPGTYRVRWYGPPGATLDLEIEAPCDFGAQNCPDELVCAPEGVCVVPPVDPQLQGEPCNIDSFESRGSCDVGLFCVGDWPEDGIDEGVCMAYCGDEGLDITCPDGLSCEHLGVCTTGCDPLAQDCEPGWGCVAELATGAGACVPAGDLGVLEPCTTLFDLCGPGLTCEDQPSIEGCHGDGWISFEGCCTPICDPDVPDPGCPAALPTCDTNEDDVVGVCKP